MHLVGWFIWMYNDARAYKPEMTSHRQIHTERYKESCAKCVKNVIKTNRKFEQLPSYLNSGDMLPSSGSRSDVLGPVASSRGGRDRSSVITSTTAHMLSTAVIIHGLDLAILHTLCHTLLFVSARGACSPGTKNSPMSVQNNRTAGMQVPPYQV